MCIDPALFITESWSNYRSGYLSESIKSHIYNSTWIKLDNILVNISQEIGVLKYEIR
jgi:hypothetical protein